MPMRLVVVAASAEDRLLLHFVLELPSTRRAK
jgi:hypothetical protein